jgi:hypothetical protein
MGLRELCPNFLEHAIKACLLSRFRDPISVRRQGWHRHVRQGTLDLNAGLSLDEDKIAAVMT